MAELNAILQAMGNPANPKPDSQGFVKDKDGASIVLEDPILTSTPEPRPIPHAPPAPTAPLAAALAEQQRIQRPPPAPVEQSTITSKPIAAPQAAKPEVPKTGELKIFLTGRSGAGKTYITTLMREHIPNVTVIDGIESARDFKALQEAGFVNYHVMCSPMTLESREHRKGIPQSLADTLDGSVKLGLMRGGSNHRLHCIWNDPQKIRPSERLLTLDEFFQQY